MKESQRIGQFADHFIMARGKMVVTVLPKYQKWARASAAAETHNLAKEVSSTMLLSSL